MNRGYSWWGRASIFGVCSFLAGCARSLPDDVRPQMEVALALRQAISGGEAGPSGGAEAAAANPTGFATFTGTFTVQGSPPAMAPLPVSGGDAGYCAPGGKAPLEETVVVGPTGGLANVLIYADMEVPEAWEHEDHVAARGLLLEGPQGFDQKGCIFLSHVFAMRATQSVELINSDSVSHNTNIAAKGRARVVNSVIPAGNKGVYAPGGASGAPFDVTCNIHPWMKAYMYVATNPYFAVTDNEGRFEIKNVPAGIDLQFRVWQEKVATNWTEVTVNGAPAQWARGRFKLNLQPDATETWEVVVNASALQ